MALPVILGALAPILAPLVGQALGGLLGGGVKAEGSASADLTGAALGNAVLGGGGGGGGGIDRDALIAAIRTVPPPVMDQVRQAVQQVRDESGSMQDLGARIAATVQTDFQPQVREILSALTLAQNQRQATWEHEELERRRASQEANDTAHRDILARLARIEAQVTRGLFVPYPIANRIGSGQALQGK